MKQTLVFISIIGLILTSCGSNKEGQLKPASKVYQNTTARYNGFFNGKELYNKSEATLDDSYRDNYNKLLPLYPHVAIENAAGVSSDLDNAMEKATVVVNLHPKSYWVDDCYFLLGKSQFLKKEYAAAEHTFEYMTDQFHPENLNESVIKYGQKYGAKKERREREVKPKVVKRTSNRKRADSKLQEEKNKAKANTQAKTRKQRLKERKEQKKESDKAKKNKGKDRSDGPAGSVSRAKKEEKEEAENREEEILEGDEMPKYFLKHRPKYTEAMLWLAKSFAADKKYADALFKLTQLENDPYVTEDILQDLHKVRAYTYLEKGELNKAIEPLKLAADFGKKKEKARIYYILGQIYQEQNKGSMASESFDQVVKLHPNYEMEFNARINSIRSEWGSGDDAQDKTIKLLERMLKDEKNEEYQDQVHFALGELYMARGLTDKAKESYRAAAESASGNPMLQAEVYLILAQFAAEEEDYIAAAGLYDTTMIHMVDTDARYKETGKIRNDLRDVADQLLEIQLQDSLIMIAGMTDDERRQFAFDIKQKELEANKFAAANLFAANGVKVASTSNFGSGSKASFFAYNDRSLKKGIKDFNKQWRNRVNEDNWRRSNKVTSGIQDNEDIDIDDLRADEMTQEEIDQILADVPKTAQDLIVAEEKKMRAMYLLAGYYDTRLGDINKSIAAYEKLLKLYPESAFSEEAYYALYLAYKRVNRMSMAESVKDKLEKYNPNSKFIQAINDPDYANKSKANNKSVITAYESAYDLFDQGNIQAAKGKVDVITQNFSVPPSIKPRLALLNALCVGGLEGKDLYMAALEGVNKDFPSTPEAKRAKEILRYLRGDSSGFDKDASADVQFEAQKNRLHYLLIVFNGVPEDVKINKLRALVSDYNLKYHKLEKLRVGNVFLSKDDKDPILIVRKFTDAHEAMEYYVSTLINKDNLLPEYNYELMVINQRNYREVLRSKSLEDYIQFFKDNYL